MSPSNNNNNNRRDKGKQRDSPIVLDFGEYDDDFSFKGDETEGLQSSGSTAAEALSRSQPYPTRSRGSIPYVEIVEVDEIDEVVDEEVEEDDDSNEDSCDEEFPPIADWSRSARRFAPP